MRVDLFNTGLRSIPMNKLVVTALALAAGLTCAPAHADSQDAAFLAAMHKRGITNVKGDPGLVSLGHTICDMLADGYSMTSLEDMGQLHAGSGMSPDDVKFLVHSSAASYCPEYDR